MIESLENEIWKDVKGYEGLYKISSFGRLLSLKGKCDRNGKYKGETIIKGEIGKPQGYYRTTLTINKIQKKYRLHRLVAETFIPNPNKLPFVNHKDGDKLNNNIDNLEWVTCAENNQHAYDNGLTTSLKGSEHPRSKINECHVFKIREMFETGKYTYNILGHIFEISDKQAEYIIKRKSWKHI